MSTSRCSSDDNLFHKPRPATRLCLRVSPGSVAGPAHSRLQSAQGLYLITSIQLSFLTGVARWAIVWQRQFKGTERGNELPRLQNVRL